MLRSGQKDSLTLSRLNFTTTIRRQNFTKLLKSDGIRNSHSFFKWCCSDRRVLGNRDMARL